MPSSDWSITEQDQLISQAVERDQPRLRSFIRKHVADDGEAEDILQDVFYELLSAYRMMKPVEHVTAWLFRVARNRIIDLFRRKKPGSLSAPAWEEEEGGTLEDLLPSAEAGPEAAYARALLIEALEEAIDELPEAQREVFIAHELLGRSFKEIAAETGVSVNTLLSRKHYAVIYLRQRLESIYTKRTMQVGKELNMKQHRILKGIKIVLFVALAAVVLGFVVRGLWNVLIPPIFGWHIITFWQALGLLVLSKILFGGFHRHGGRDHWRHRMKERWEHMSPEQREQFRKGMRCGRGPIATPAEPQI